MTRTRGRSIAGETVADIREARARMRSKTTLSVADQIADAVVAIYGSKVVPRLRLEDLAVIADLDVDTVREAYLRRLDRLSRPQVNKRCPRCGRKKSVEDYYKRRSSLDGLYPWCKSCWDGYLDQRRAARAQADAADGAHVRSR